MPLRPVRFWDLPSTPQAREWTAQEAVNSGDLDGDGDVDLIASNFNSAKMSVLMNDGSGNFSQSSSPDVGNGPELGIIADVDLDGDFDLAS